MSVSVDIKQGDTLLLECLVKIDGIVQNITNWTIESSVKYSNFTDTLVITKTDPTNGKFTLGKADTTAWPAAIDPPKYIMCDIEYTMPSGQIISTENFTFNCYQGIT